MDNLVIKLIDMQNKGTMEYTEAATRSAKVLTDWDRMTEDEKKEMFASVSGF